MCCPLLGPAERGALLSASVLDERQINDFNNSLATTTSALSEAGLSLDLLLALNAWRELTWYPAQDQELDHDHFLFWGGNPGHVACCLARVHKHLTHTIEAPGLSATFAVGVHAHADSHVRADPLPSKSPC